MSEQSNDRGFFLSVLIHLYAAGATLFGMAADGESEPVVPPEYVESNFERNPRTVGTHGERIAEGTLTIPHGRAIRLAYEHQPAEGDFYVIREASFDGNLVGNVDVTEMNVVEPDGVVLPEPKLHSGYPEEPPAAFAASHFHLHQDGELTDGFMQCLDRDVDPEDYPVNPVRIE